MLLSLGSNSKMLLRSNQVTGCESWWCSYENDYSICGVSLIHFEGSSNRSVWTANILLSSLSSGRPQSRPPAFLLPGLWLWWRVRAKESSKTVVKEDPCPTAQSPSKLQRQLQSGFLISPKIVLDLYLIYKEEGKLTASPSFVLIYLVFQKNWWYLRNSQSR